MNERFKDLLPEKYKNYVELLQGNYLNIHNWYIIRKNGWVEQIFPLHATKRTVKGTRIRRRRWRGGRGKVRRRGGSQKWWLI